MTNHLETCYRDVRRTEGFAAMHEEGIRTVYEAVLRPGDIAVDAGAHAGKHTIPMARAVGRTGSVVAFEPLDEGRSRLERALEQEDLPQVEVSSLAVSDESGLEVTFLYFPDRPGISSMQRREDVPELHVEERSAMTTVVDDWVADVDVTFIKLDVEGAEMLALRGAASTIARSRPVIHVEAGLVSWRPFGYGPRELHAWCGEHAYRCFDAVGHRLTTAEDVEASFDAAGVWDYILVPEESRHAETVQMALAGHAKRFRRGPLRRLMRRGRRPRPLDCPR